MWQIIADVIHYYGWRRVCTLSGSDEYLLEDSKNSASIAETSTSPDMKQLLYRNDDLSSEISALGRAQCSIVVLWAQAADIRTIGEECYGRKY